jgi:hypothetical protein
MNLFVKAAKVSFLRFHVKVSTLCQVHALHCNDSKKRGFLSINQNETRVHNYYMEFFSIEVIISDNNKKAAVVVGGLITTNSKCVGGFAAKVQGPHCS